MQQGAKRKDGVGQVKEKTASWKAMVASMEDLDSWQERGLEKYGTHLRGERTQLGRKEQRAAVVRTIASQDGPVLDS